MNKELVGILDRIIVLLEQHREDELKTLLAGYHPADLAEVLEELDEEQQAAVVACLSDDTAAEALSELEAEDQAAILEALPEERAGDILEEMAPDDVADLVAELPETQAEDLLELMESEEAGDVRELLTYAEDTAGGLMTTEYIALESGLTAQAAIDELRRLAPDAESAYYVYVVAADEKLLGVISLRDLIIAPPVTPLAQIMRTQIIAVNVDDDQESVARLVQKYNLLAVPVVDANQTLRGIITVDDVLDVIQEEATEDIYRAAGVTGDEEHQELEGGVWRAVKARLPWLASLVFLEMISGVVIDRFNGLLATFAVLSVFITTMSGEAGNAATQSLAVVLRGLATGDLKRSDLARIVWKELRVGALVGLGCGVVLALTSILWQHSVTMAVIAGIAIFLNLVVAKICGGFFPVLIEAFGIDPAVASGPLITTITDSTSMLIYFGVAAVVLRFMSMH